MQRAVKPPPLEDLLEDLRDAAQAFEAAPTADRLDDVYRMTAEIESACRARLAQA